MSRTPSVSKRAAERAHRFVQVLAEIADLARVLLHRLLLPAVGHRPQQRDQGRRARRDDAPFDAAFDQRRILLERGAEEHLAGQEHDDELGRRTRPCRSSSSPRAARCGPRTCRAWSASSFWRDVLVGRLERAQVGVERRLGVDDDLLAARQPDDDVRPNPGLVVAALNRALLVEVAVLDHPGELDDALQLELAPAAADAGPLERVGEAPRLVAQALAGGVERDDPLHQLRARFDAAALGVLDLAVHLLERLRHRRQQILDRLLARVDVAGGLRARFAQTRFGQREERFVVGLERVGAERLERVAQLRLGLARTPSAARRGRRDLFRARAGDARARDATPASPPARRWRDPGSA